MKKYKVLLTLVLGFMESLGMVLKVYAIRAVDDVNVDPVVQDRATNTSHRLPYELFIAITIFATTLIAVGILVWFLKKRRK